MTDSLTTGISFASLDLDERILAGVKDKGFTACTPIQAETLPLALQGQDIAGQAQTGTGKTAAFLLVVLQRLLETPETEARPYNAVDSIKSAPRALIIAPTRELAIQIYNDAVALSAHTSLKSTVVFGGSGYLQQREEVEAGVDILVGTPGRLIDYYKQHVYSLRDIRIVVLDEADRMFDLGFIKDIRFLFKHMPPPEERQGLLFSATLSYRVNELAYEHMNNPKLIHVEAEQVTADRVTQCCYMTANEDKIPLLIGLLRSWQDARVIVFVNTKRAGNEVWGYLKGNGFNPMILSGDIPQKTRIKVLQEFTNGKLSVLVATDVAARGLHIPDVTHVVNFDLPEDPEDYVHRIGRTARAGAAGDAISMVCETYAFCLPDIEAYINARIPVLPVTDDLLATIAPDSLVKVESKDSIRLSRQQREDKRPRRAERPERTERSVADKAPVERQDTPKPNRTEPKNHDRRVVNKVSADTNDVELTVDTDSELQIEITEEQTGFAGKRFRRIRVQHEVAALTSPKPNNRNREQLPSVFLQPLVKKSVVADTSSTAPEEPKYLPILVAPSTTSETEILSTQETGAIPEPHPTTNPDIAPDNQSSEMVDDQETEANEEQISKPRRRRRGGRNRKPTIEASEDSAEKGTADNTPTHPEEVSGQSHADI